MEGVGGDTASWIFRSLRGAPGSQLRGVGLMRGYARAPHVDGIGGSPSWQHTVCSGVRRPQMSLPSDHVAWRHSFRLPNENVIQPVEGHRIAQLPAYLLPKVVHEMPQVPCLCTAPVRQFPASGDAICSRPHIVRQGDDPCLFLFYAAWDVTTISISTMAARCHSAGPACWTPHRRTLSPRCAV